MRELKKGEMVLSGVLLRVYSEPEDKDWTSNDGARYEWREFRCQTPNRNVHTLRASAGVVLVMDESYVCDVIVQTDGKARVEVASAVPAPKMAGAPAPAAAGAVRA